VKVSPDGPFVPTSPITNELATVGVANKVTLGARLDPVVGIGFAGVSVGDELV
jgi:hypothetical protein